ncbi:rRNA-binding ribosome biosynthesis protein SCDLUD_004649 [Saccharomycodes ludwigii]|uniref:rRNA-binding ribosome biosynthesis protein n=1 Tax=Saccharomycodes ludwigii TaxID=36035 RepID=UPI001E849FEF|nr:hypothetical protein SCDLUD_004649 [Saccharomycodes ludwigii]KAH3899217.1 hypothetical protein SCDLUD_004649 [Saccharomycodes ludwigii]
MAKRRHKKRTHVKVPEETLSSIPKSMVIRVGNTSMHSHALSQLVKDFRNVMQPHTAIKLKERKSNRLKDFIVMCGPLKVSHLFMFTQSEKTGNVHLKIARAPTGPTVTYQVVKYSLARDVKKYLKRPKSLTTEDLLNPPLLVLNGFSTKNGEVEKVIISMFQNMFPALNPSATKLNSIKRVFMINKDPATGLVEMRHYQISVKDMDISRNLKKLYKSEHNLHKGVPNLSRKHDISSLILDHDIGAYTSESEAEIDADAIVRIQEERTVHASSSKKIKKKTADEPSQENKEESENLANPVELQSRKKAIKLTECGPRLTLRLVKIEEGICSGKILHHEFVSKTDDEIRALEKKHAAKMKLKEQRRKEQEEHIAQKKAVKEAKKQRKLERRQLRKEQQEKDESTKNAENSGSNSSSSEEDGESEHGYSDVPEDLDSDLFSEVDES